MACAAMRIAAGEGCREGWEQGSAWAWTTGGSALSGSLGSSGILTGTFGAAAAAAAAGAAAGATGVAGVAGVGVPAGDGTRVSRRSGPEPSFSRERILDRNALL
mmetsp:Transcript_60617/g.84316  ORF Transcript_60617/g.84316 Transcript_60617/m.84316 type:complete len:104 (+) Transcript_60617:166-477(+)